MRKKIDRDILIIGSGFGGAVAALRLAEAGHDVTVLERGKRWTGANAFATYEKPDGRSAWLSETTVDPLHAPTPIKRYPGILDRKIGNGIATLSGAGWGGGSLAFTGALVQPDSAAFSRLFPWLDYDRMRICYERVRAVIHAVPVPAHLLVSDPHFEQARLFEGWVQQAGLTTEYFDMAIDWEVVRQELSGDIESAYTAGQNWYGLNSGAKKSLDKNYLAQAEATGHVETCTLHVVQSIAKLEQTERFIISGIEIDENGTTIKPFTYSSRVVFLAAGSIASSELMVRAKTTRTLPFLAFNEQVGKGWGNNGDVIGMHRGHTSTSSAVVPQVAAGIGTLHEHEQGRTRLMGDAINGTSPDSLLTLAMVQPASGYPNTGTFTYNALTDQVNLHWHDLSHQHMDIASQTYTLLDNHSSPHQMFSTPLVQTSITAHPLGGMVLGSACERTDGHVIGYENLYIVDGSLLPGWAGGVPPALTIAALAEHILDLFCHRFQ